jgi:hypothetical protein
MAINRGIGSDAVVNNGIGSKNPGQKWYQRYRDLHYYSDCSTEIVKKQGLIWTQDPEGRLVLCHKGYIEIG